MKTILVVLTVLFYTFNCCGQMSKELIHLNNAIVIKSLFGEYDSLEILCNIALKIDSENSLALSFRGDAKRRLGDNIGALYDLNKAILISNEKYGLPFFFRGLVKFNLEDYKSAIIDFDKHINLSITDDNCTIGSEFGPTNCAWAYFYKGKAKIILGQKLNGCEDLSKSGELGISKAYDLIKEYCN